MITNNGVYLKQIIVQNCSLGLTYNNTTGYCVNTTAVIIANTTTYANQTNLTLTSNYTNMTFNSSSNFTSSNYTNATYTSTNYTNSSALIN